MSKVNTKPSKSGPTEERAIPNTHSFSLLSYNVNFGSFYPTNCTPPHEAWKVLGAILEADADVVCLQETNMGWERFLKQRLEHMYPHQQWLDPGQMMLNYLAAGSALLTKRECPIRWMNPVRVSAKGSFFPQMVAVVDLGPTRGEIALVNVHLRPPLAMGDYLTEPTSGFNHHSLGQTIREVGAHAWAYLHEAGQVHARELRHLMSPTTLTGGKPARDQAVKAGSAAPMTESVRSPPVFVVGDFNEGYWGAGCRHMRAHGYTDAVANKTTWYWPVWGGRIMLRGSYDHIFHRRSGPWALSSARVMKGYYEMSDHLPVVAHFNSRGGIVTKDTS